LPHDPFTLLPGILLSFALLLGVAQFLGLGKARGSSGGLGFGFIAPGFGFCLSACFFRGVLTFFVCFKTVSAILEEIADG
jgi:hypothetical protein